MVRTSVFGFCICSSCLWNLLFIGCSILHRLFMLAQSSCVFVKSQQLWVYITIFSTLGTARHSFGRFDHLFWTGKSSNQLFFWDLGHTIDQIIAFWIRSLACLMWLTQSSNTCSFYQFLPVSTYYLKPTNDCYCATNNSPVLSSLQSYGVYQSLTNNNVLMI